MSRCPKTTSSPGSADLGHNGTMVTVAGSGIVAVVHLARQAEEADTSEIGPGLIAFTIVVLLAVATFFLLRSMMRHIAKVPPTFESDSTDDPSGGDVG